MQLPIQLQFSTVSSFRYTPRVGVSASAITDTQLYRLLNFLRKNGSELFGVQLLTARVSERVDEAGVACGVLALAYGTSLTGLHGVVAHRSSLGPAGPRYVPFLAKFQMEKNGKK